MDSDLLAACARLTEAVQSFYPLIRVSAILAGFVLVGVALAGMKNRQAQGRSVLPALVALVVGVMLVSFSSVLDGLSLAVFNQSAPDGISTVSVGSSAGLENMVRLAVAIVMVVGAYQVVKGLVLLKEAAEGARVFWPAITHIVAGVLCFNIRTFTLALGATFGGSLEDLVNTLFGG